MNPLKKWLKTDKSSVIISQIVGGSAAFCVTAGFFFFLFPFFWMRENSCCMIGQFIFASHKGGYCMRSKISMFKRILSATLVMALLIGVLPMSIFSLGIVDTDNKIVDPNTMNEWENFFGRTDTAYAGAVWTDKSVFRDASAFADVNKLATGAGTAITVGQNNFLVALSAIASTSVVKGYSTKPTDTMLVLDGDSLETA